MNIKCWWFGCSAHPQDPAPPEYLECQRCGEIMDYERLAGITRWNAFKDFFKYWFWRRWDLSRCKGCGRRWGHDDDCLPF